MAKVVCLLQSWGEGMDARETAEHAQLAYVYQTEIKGKRKPPTVVRGRGGLLCMRRGRSVEGLAP